MPPPPDPPEGPLRVVPNSITLNERSSAGYGYSPALGACEIILYDVIGDRRRCEIDIDAPGPVLRVKC